MYPAHATRPCCYMTAVFRSWLHWCWFPDRGDGELWVAVVARLLHPWNYFDDSSADASFSYGSRIGLVGSVPSLAILGSARLGFAVLGLTIPGLTVSVLHRDVA